MSYTVTLYFDNMIDETHYFDEKEEAMKQVLIDLIEEYNWQLEETDE